MNKAIKRITTIFICFIFIASTVADASALTINAKSAMLMDASSGEVIFEQNADQPLKPGSMVKLMTVYIILDQVRQGNITLETPVTISSNTAKLSRNLVYSNVPLKVNQRYTMKQLMESIIVVSACASAKAVAEYFSGTEEAFTQRMNHYALSMGIDANFVDSSGISNYNSITARSMAILSKRLVADFPNVLDYAKKTSITFAGKTYQSSNLMLEGMPQYYFGADGLKTGFIDESKYCFAGTANRENVRLISVVMGAEKKFDRFDETRKLFDYGFEKMKIQSPWKHAQAKPSDSCVKVDGQTVPFEIYDIEGSHYIKLRDLAVSFNETNKSFNVAWDPNINAILLNTNDKYEPTGEEMSAYDDVVKDSIAINSKIYLNGARIRFKGYSIDGNYFFNLRDVTEAINVGLVWDGSNKTIQMDGSTEYVK